MPRGGGGREGGREGGRVKEERVSAWAYAASREGGREGRWVIVVMATRGK